jgi:hypothetical protein
MRYIVLPQFTRMEGDTSTPTGEDPAGEGAEGGIEQGLGPGDRDDWWQDESTDE